MRHFVLVLLIATLISCREAKYESPAMEPTIKQDETITINYSAYLTSQPERWDAVAFKNDRTKGRVWVQRIVGLPGETIDIQDSFIVINGAKLEYPKKISTIRYTSRWADTPPAVTLPYTLPAHSYFVLGDNTSQAIDSRYIGSILKEDIKGKVEGK